MTLLKNVIGYSKTRLNLAVNPVNSEDVKRPAVSDERNVRLSDDQIDLLIAECYAAESPYAGPLVEFAFESAARRGSMLRLLWQDVDLKAGSAILRRVKNSRRPDEQRDIKIGLSPRAIEILTVLPRSNSDPERVFPLTVGALAGAFKRARARAKLEFFRLHDARHERTSNLIEAGWSDSEVMAQTGHLDHKSLKRYTTLRGTFLGDKLAQLPARERRRVAAEV